MVAKTDFRTWHKRLNHIKVARLQHGMVNRVKFSETNKKLKGFDCEVCSFGKIHHKPIYNHPNSRVENVKKKLHWDLYGSMKVLGEGGVLYIVVTVDDASRLIFTNFLTSKSQGPESIKMVITEVET
jgi:hypothetical protein